MKKYLFASLTILFFFSCNNDDYLRGLRAPRGDEGLEAKVDGRIVAAYATSYGTATPNPYFFTHINYAFAEVYISKDSVYQGFKVQGSEARFQQIAGLKKKFPDLKISISFTDAQTNSDNPKGGSFSLLAKSETRRRQFAEDCRRFLQEWNLDGVDMDWEFPGLSWSGDKKAYDVAVDVENHVLLMKQLRETLGNNYLLTYAGYCMDVQPVDGGSRYIDIAAVAPYVDYVYIMTYDLDAAPNHQSALLSPAAKSDCTRAVKAYLDAGMDPGKLILGIPFYGRRSFSETPQAINYRDIVQLSPLDGYEIDNWYEEGQVPYVTLDGEFYCGYDNPESIAVKGKWMLDKGMAGMMYWDYDGDDRAGTLRRAVWQATMKQ